MSGGIILAAIGLLALLAGACELLLRRGRRPVTIDLMGAYPPHGDAGCVWPRLEPEVEALRHKGAL